jgi:AcrR family transcriptional regulator
MNRDREMSGIGHIGRNDWKNGEGHTSAGIDRRAARTRAALHTALIRLILEKDYEEISVSDIVDAANVGRSTFYVHFTGKDDLLRYGAGSMREMFAAHSGGSENAPPFAFSSFLFAHTKEELRLYRAVVKSRAVAIVFDKLRQTLSDVVRDELDKLEVAQDEGPGNTVPREVTVQYLVGAFMSVLTAWLDRGAKEPPEQMDAAFRTLALRTVGAYRPAGSLANSNAD